MEAIDGIEEVLLEGKRPERTVQLGWEMEATIRHSLIKLL